MGVSFACSAGYRRPFLILVAAWFCLSLTGSAASGQEDDKASKAGKWIGTWNEPYALVGTRQIIKIWEEDGQLLGTQSNPDPVYGFGMARIPFKLQEVKIVDDETLSWKESGLTVTAKFIPGKDGSPATMETSKEAKGTIGWYLGQRKPHVARLKKE
jgi:hypothetical protein